MSAPRFWTVHRRWVPVVLLCLAIAAVMSVRYVQFVWDFPPEPYVGSPLTRPVSSLWGGIPLAAALACWEGGRLRRADLWRVRSVSRSPFAVFMRHCWPYVATVFVTYLGLMLWEFGRVKLVPGPDGVLPLALVCLTIAAIIIGGIAFGYWVGLVLPLPIALPVVILGLFLWITAPRQNDAVPSVRHITGFGLDDCCGRLDTVPAWQALVAPLTVSLVVGLGGVLAFSGRRSFARATSFTVAGVASVVGALVVVAPLSWTPTEPRAESQLVCAGTPVEVCAWPEQPASSETVAVLEQAASRAAELGFVTPRSIKPIPVDLAPGYVPWAPLAVGGMSQPQILDEFATAIVFATACPDPDGEHADDPAVLSMENVRYELARDIGASPPPPYDFGITPLTIDEWLASPAACTQKERS